MTYDVTILPPRTYYCMLPRVYVVESHLMRSPLLQEPRVSIVSFEFALNAYTCEKDRVNMFSDKTTNTSVQ